MSVKRIVILLLLIGGIVAAFVWFGGDHHYRNFPPTAVGPWVAFGDSLSREHSLLDLLRRPGVTYETLREWMPEGTPEPGTTEAEQIEIAAKYSGYVERQKDEVARQLAQESVPLPADLDYASVRGLSKEVQQRLGQHRPQTVGQASRIQGVTPAAIALLLVHMKRRAHADAQGKKSA